MMLLRPLTSFGRAGVRKPLSFGVAAALLAMCTAAAAGAQTPSLAEIARKEQERRKAVPTPQKVYTNKDLPPSAVVPAAPDTPAPTSVTDAPPGGQDEQAPAREEKDESWWRNRITSAREELRRNEAFVEALQSRINSLSADFVNRDDPYQRAKIGEDRQKALAEMERVKREIDQGKKLIEDIEEEARKAGVPPGWLR